MQSAGRGGPTFCLFFLLCHLRFKVSRWQTDRNANCLSEMTPLSVFPEVPLPSEESEVFARIDTMREWVWLARVGYSVDRDFTCELAGFWRKSDGGTGCWHSSFLITSWLFSIECCHERSDFICFSQILHLLWPLTHLDQWLFSMTFKFTARFRFWRRSLS